MQIETKGRGRRQGKRGEEDQRRTLLNLDVGVRGEAAKGRRRLKKKRGSACGHFSYSEFVLTSGRSHYFVDDAQVKKVFYGVSSTVEGLALASYMAEVAAELSPAPPEAEAQLRLLLNCLYMICEKKRPWRQLKAIYELRALCLAGYMPDILACANCGKYDGGSFYFSPVEGRLLCADCADRERHLPNLDPGALYALRHICLSEDNKLFSFSLADASLKNLSGVCEQYLLTHLDHGLKTLDFLKTVVE